MKHTWPLIDAKKNLEEAYSFYRVLSRQDKDYSLTASRLFDMLELLDVMIDDIHMCKRND